MSLDEWDSGSRRKTNRKGSFGAELGTRCRGEMVIKGEGSYDGQLAVDRNKE